MDLVEAAATRTDHKGPEAGRVVAVALRVEPGETFVVVVVPGQHDVRAVVGQGLPDRAVGGVVAVFARAEPGLVPERQRTAGRVPDQILTQPGDLRRTGPAAADRVALRVQRDQVPRPGVEAVVTLPGRPDPLREVPEVPGRAAGVVL